jgi:hypothetical protein
MLPVCTAICHQYFECNLHIVWTISHCSPAYMLHIQVFNCAIWLFAVMSHISLEAILQLIRNWNVVFFRSVESDTQFVVHGYTFLCFQGIQVWFFNHWFWMLSSHNNLVVHYFLLLTCFFSSNVYLKKSCITVLEYFNTLRTGHLNCFKRTFPGFNQCKSTFILFLEEFIKNSLTVFVNWNFQEILTVDHRAIRRKAQCLALLSV